MRWDDGAVFVAWVCRYAWLFDFVVAAEGGSIVVRLFCIVFVYGAHIVYAQVKKIPKDDDPWNLKGRAVLFVDEDILDSE